jgi:predicted peroxiredoxin
MDAPRKTVQTLVVLTTGKQDRGTRATLAFSWACTALAMGQSASVFCTMEGTLWAYRKSLPNTRVDGFEPLDVYVEQFLTLGGRLLVCAPCSEYYCAYDRAQMSEMLIEGAEVTGLTSVVSLIGPGSTVVTF